MGDQFESADRDEEAAVMPYQIATLYQIERPKTAAEIRLADEHAARVAAAVADLVRPLTRAGRRWRARQDRLATDYRVQASCRRDMMSTTMEVR
ncbi:MAG TPA: hypothetical protein VK836_24575 [Streptosporangiaceae bacterium]|nr:hypothetical protein [Streptosporangiaceae bacterium]